MLKHRNWILRASIFVNAAVLFYFAAYYTIRNGSLDLSDDFQFASSHNAEFIQVGNEIANNLGVYSELADNPKSAPLVAVSSGNGANPSASSSFGQQSPSINPIVQGTTTNAQGRSVRLSTTLKSTDSSFAESMVLGGVGGSGSGNGISIRESSLQDFAAIVAGGGGGSISTPQAQAGAATEGTSNLRDVIQCHDKGNDYAIAQKGEFWVLYNYVTANRTYACHESVTYTTHADFTFLDNLQPLIERWRGPISLALYAPGTDFASTLASIRYLRKCNSPLISEYVTFHVYFEAKHLPKTIPKPREAINGDGAVDCGAPPPWQNVSVSSLYRSHKKLLYPVNVGRNVARDSAQTHYILASDIELYPSPGIIGDFLEMIRRQDAPLMHNKPKVFPLCLFEVESYASPPATKEELVHMLNNGTAIPFHKHVCPDCHTVPKHKEWLKAPIKSGLHVFHIAKRKGRWEPIFIGTNNDPYYDERLSWEGRSDKMTQGYALCVLDYEFQILDNAFLVHRPGIKKFKQDRSRAIISAKTQSIIRHYSYPELKVFYGVRKGCIV